MITLSTNLELDDPTKTSCQHIVDVFDIEDLHWVVSHCATCCSEFSDGWDNYGRFIKSQRRAINFVSSNCCFLDFDNGDVTIEDFMAKNPEFEYFITTSKSHTPEQHRFHVFLPIEKITDRQTYKNYQTVLVKYLFPKSDPNCKDISKPLAGNPNTEVYYNPGKSIVEKIEPKLRLLAKKPVIKSNFSAKNSNNSFKDFVLRKLKDCDWSDYNDWITLGAALRNSRFTLEDWIYLSDVDVDEREMEYKWNSFNNFNADFHYLQSIINKTYKKMVI